ncbi:hypothetical protein [Acidocella sp.]|jgi:hypothetical protein|uniref:hypothetical protein n=1 Tax=Acidocella sp. TaxID=50710 RepID=UPI002F4205E5
MPRWFLAVFLSLGMAGSAAAQQVGAEVNGGLNSDGGAMYGATINRVLGTNPNGTPRQVSPGASMTNGAGNSTMTPGIAGGSVEPPPIRGLLHGYAIPTINGQAATSQ